MKTEFLCSVCNTTVSAEHESFTTGYGRDREGNKVCYACCAERDKAYMREHGKIALYLSYNQIPNMVPGRIYQVTGGEVSNWPGSLVFPIRVVFVGRHNIARRSYRVYFDFEDHEWTGVNYGNRTQICHCKRTKRPSQDRRIKMITAFTDKLKSANLTGADLSGANLSFLKSPWT